MSRATRSRTRRSRTANGSERRKEDRWIVRIPSLDGDAESKKKREQKFGSWKKQLEERKFVATQQPRSLGTPIKVIGVGDLPTELEKGHGAS